MDYLPIIQRTHAYLCLDCGKCTGSCPLARVDPEYSPRRIVERVVFGEAESVIADPRLWSCMTCGLCSARCPSKVDFSRFILEMRAEAFGTGERGVYAHDGILQEVMRIQTMTAHQDRTSWITDDLSVSEKGDYQLFVGCLPYFEVIFAGLDVEALDIARGAVRLLNRIGISPIVSNDERCCGADLLLAGDVDSFKKLAELNVEAIVNGGAQTVVFTCAECYKAFRSDYEEHVGPLPFKMTHLTELLEGALDAGELAFEASDGSVTFHDPCRLGRYLKVYEPPRRVINSVDGVDLREMEDNRERALCCGSTGWVSCSASAKLIQREKLRQARETGARTMLTACPKCQIHLSCASRDLPGEQRISIKDVTTWASESLARGHLSDE